MHIFNLSNPILLFTKQFYRVKYCLWSQIQFRNQNRVTRLNKIQFLLKMFTLYVQF